MLCGMLCGLLQSRLGELVAALRGESLDQIVQKLDRLKGGQRMITTLVQVLVILALQEQLTTEAVLTIVQEILKGDLEVIHVRRRLLVLAPASVG